MPTPATGGTKYWFNGLPLDGLERTGYDTGTAKYWFNGLPYDTLASTAPAGITATASLNQADNTIVATATVGTPPTPATPTQVFIDIQTAARSFTTRKRMF